MPARESKPRGGEKVDESDRGEGRPEGPCNLGESASSPRCTDQQSCSSDHLWSHGGFAWAGKNLSIRARDLNYQSKGNNAILREPAGNNKDFVKRASFAAYNGG